MVHQECNKLAICQLLLLPFTLLGHGGHCDCDHQDIFPKAFSLMIQHRYQALQSQLDSVAQPKLCLLSGCSKSSCLQGQLCRTSIFKYLVKLRDHFHLFHKRLCCIATNSACLVVVSLFGYREMQLLPVRFSRIDIPTKRVEKKSSLHRHCWKLLRLKMILVALDDEDSSKDRSSKVSSRSRNTLSLTLLLLALLLGEYD